MRRAALGALANEIHNTSGVRIARGSSRASAQGGFYVLVH